MKLDRCKIDTVHFQAEHSHKKRNERLSNMLSNFLYLSVPTSLMERIKMCVQIVGFLSLDRFFLLNFIVNLDDRMDWADTCVHVINNLYNVLDGHGTKKNVSCK